jgi:serine/threonine-protein kinase
VPAPARKLAKRPTGSKLGKYTLTQVLGQGGYGDVHLGATLAGPKVAVKVLNAAASRDEDTVTRFKRESDTAQRLAHPGIVRILEVGSSRGRHYIVMELVRGGSFRKLLERPDVPPSTVIAVLAEVAHALAFAHAQGVVHRDVKPANVLLTRSGRAKVADFGLARSVDQSSLTTEGRILGTAVYMSPEQVRGQRATAASDVYSLGIMIYEAITGELPFSAETQLGFLYQHAEVEPPPPVVRGGYPNALAQLALACLAKDAAARPSMAEVAAALDQAQRPPGALRVAWRAVRRFARRAIRRLLLIAIAALVVASIVAIAAPQLLDPLCNDWFGGASFRLARRGAQAAHDAIFGASPASPAPAPSPPSKPAR